MTDYCKLAMGCKIIWGVVLLNLNNVLLQCIIYAGNLRLKSVRHKNNEWQSDTRSIRTKIKIQKFAPYVNLGGGGVDG